MLTCSWTGCQAAAAFSTVAALAEHMRVSHGWHPQHRTVCRYNGCGKRHKTKKSFARHARTHTGAKPYPCRHPPCSATFSRSDHLRNHLEAVHDVGEHECAYCYGNRNSRIELEDANATGGRVYVCRACYRKATGKESRVEVRWSDYVDAALGTEGLMGQDDALRTLGGCSRRRPDKLYGDPAAGGHLELDECDEYQHRDRYSYACEQGRLMELYEDPSIFGRPLVVIRWNPHNYDGPDATEAERLALFVMLKRAVRRQRRAAPPGAEFPRIVIYYMFYNRDSPQICRDLEYHHVNTAADVAPLTALIPVDPPVARLSQLSVSCSSEGWARLPFAHSTATTTTP